jgi:hypothetical protein
MVLRKFALPGLLAGLLLVIVAVGIGVARGQNNTPPGVKREVQGSNVREVSAPISSSVSSANPQAPAISFIDSRTPYCYQPEPGSDTCYVNWYSHFVDASPNYMTMFTITLGSNVVLRANGFFQTSMSLYSAQFGQGFKVSCGARGAGGDAQLGNNYSYVIQARDSTNLGSANYGSIYCPARNP